MPSKIRRSALTGWWPFMSHDGFGLSLDLVAKATGVTKGMVHKRIISARKRIAAKKAGLAAA